MAPFDPDLYKRALDFAARVHGDQKVPGSGFPYVVHVAKVAMEVLGATEDDDAATRNLAMACALLHDTLEDSPADQRSRIRTELGEDFGPEVLAGVLALTKDAQLEKDERMDDSLRRIKDQPRAIWVVKLADRITNLEPPPPAWSKHKCRQYVDEARRILEGLGEASDRLRQRFEQKLADYERQYATLGPSRPA